MTYTVKNNTLYLMKLPPQSILDFLKDFKTLSTLLIASLMLIAMSLVLIDVVVVVCFSLQALSWGSDECLGRGNIRLANYMLILWCNRWDTNTLISMMERGGCDGWRRREINQPIFVWHSHCIEWGTMVMHSEVEVVALRNDERRWRQRTKLQDGRRSCS